MMLDIADRLNFLAVLTDIEWLYVTGPVVSHRAQKGKSIRRHARVLR
jgi:hypothetical protein